ncbi:MAG: squalene synthase HpnC [Deltaproteobacteria bacterium]|nr:squalene synthase HpnC [Deltaproteobacteria bacterium]
MIRHVVGTQGRSQGPIAVTPPSPGPSGKPDLAACYRYCEDLARAHHENFPIASRFLPARLRKHVCALYAFARTADDFADEPAFAERRALELDRWEDLLLRCFHGVAEHPIFVALGHTAQEFDLPITPLSDILSAFRMDLRVRRHATWNDLTAYTSLAAHPVGRLLLYMFGCRDAKRHRYAEELSTALALTNFWQDIARDLDRDRIYLPQEDLRHFGVAEEDLFARRQSPELTALVRYECARARAIYERARPLLDLMSEDLAVEISLFWHGGIRALSRVEERAHDVFGERATLTLVDKAWILGQAVRRGIVPLTLAMTSRFPIPGERT